MTAPADVIGVARRYIGVKESPPNSNHQQFGVWFGMDHVPWCAEFASFCLYVAGLRWTDATYPKGFTYCPDIINWGQRHGRASRTPHVGDLAVKVDHGIGHHVGIVTSVLAAGQFGFCSGNTGAASFSNGGCVQENIQQAANGWVFVSPLYSAPAAHTAPPSGGKPSPVKRNIALTSPLTTGKDILWAQEKLAGLHYPISKADGIYGPQTSAAVRAFQHKVGLTADGILGPVTGDHLVAGK